MEQVGYALVAAAGPIATFGLPKFVNAAVTPIWLVTPNTCER